MGTLSRQGADVRVNEVNLSASLVQNSNAVAALVGVSAQGPIGPKFYSTYDQFVNDWGQPNASVSFDHYAAQDYFREGNSLWAARAVNSDALFGCMALAAEGNSSSYQVIPIGVTTNNPLTFDISTVVWGGISPKPMYMFYPTKGHGSYSGNLSLEIISQNLYQITNAGATVYSATGGSLDTSTYEYRISAVNKEGMEFRCSAVAAVTPSSGTTNQIKVTWNKTRDAVAYRVYGRNAGTPFFIAQVGAAVNSYIDTGSVTPDTGRPPITGNPNIVTYSQKFKVNIYDSTVSNVNPVESFDCTQYDGIDELGQATEIQQRINNFSKYVRVISYLSLLVNPPPVRSMEKTAMIAGTSGSAPTNNQINATWDLFRDKEKYTIDLLIGAGRTTVSIQNNMNSIAETRADCVAFLDVPSASQAAQDAVDFRNVTLNMNSSYSALFTSDLYESDPYTGKVLYIPPSGAMAGLVARTTRVAQPWYSPAGLNRGLLSALDIRYKYEDGDATLLANAQVNYPRKFAGRGIPLWEQWTLANQASALQFLNVRILCNVIKRTMYQYLLYALQEPNDDILRRQIKYGLEEYLKYVQGARGISSYTVTCDSTNNTPALVNSGTLAVSVYIVPILAVRQINLTLIVGKYGLQITESDIAALSA